MKKFIAIYLVMAVFLTVLAVAWVSSGNRNAGSTETLVDNGKIVFLIERETGLILYANSAAIDFYGYTGQQLEQMTFKGLEASIGPDGNTPVDTLQPGARHTIEHRLSGGDVRTVEVSADPLAYKDDGVLLITVTDVSAMEFVQQRAKTLTTIVYIVAGGIILILLGLIWLLLNSRRRIRTDKAQIEALNAQMQTYIDANPDLVYLKDENLRYIFTNKSLENFYHKPKSEIIGHDDFSLSEEEFARKRRESDITALESETQFVSETQWEGRLYRSCKFPVRLASGRTGIGAVVSDITKERAEQRRREKESDRNQILLDVFTHSFENNQELLNYALHGSLKLTDSKYGYIYLYSEATKEFTLNSWTKGAMEDCSIVEPQTVYQLDKTGFWGDVVRFRKPVIVNDFQKPNPRKKGYPEGHVEIETYMSLPVMINDEIVAVAGFANNPSGYDDNDVYEVTLLMSGVWNDLVRRQVRDNLSYERNRFLQTLLSIGDGVIVVNCDGIVDMINKIAEELTGWSIGDARGRHYSDILTLDTLKEGETVEDPIHLALTTGQPQSLASQAFLISKDGKRYDLEDSAAPIRDYSGHMVGAVLVFRDVTEKKEQQKEIEYLSLHDMLTGLYNRRFYEAEMKRLDTPRNLPLTVIMGDVNNLKLTNDIFGHEYGDKLLNTVADVFRRVCRADDIIARWGGDEFVILLPNTGEEEANNIIERIKTEFAKEQVRSIQGSISMGYSIKKAQNEDIRAHFHQAEERMYAVKSMEYETIQKSAMDAIIRSMNSFSKDEKQHAANVSAHCTEIGRALGLPGTDIRRLSDAGYLHDIGKIVYKPDFLNKQPPWSEEDQREFKRHPLVGHRILSLFDPSQMLSEAVLAHHERWDGFGYPKGISGESIPLMARIISVAEHYDRLINPEDKSQAVKPGEALEKIRKMSGKNFDPKIVEVFTGIMENKHNGEREDG